MKACILFTKIPAEGYTKTRLEEVLGRAGCVQFAQQLFDHTWAELQKTDIPLFVAYASKNAQAPTIPGATECFAQQGEDLGARMHHAMETVFEKGYDTVVLLGSDLPYLKADDVLKAFDALGTHAVVLGPSTDGGYYLIGAQKRCYTNALFTIDVPWSSACVYQATTRAALKQGCTVASINAQPDCDTEEDLQKLLQNAPEHPLSKWLQRHLSI